jgi:predicted ATPase
MVGKKTELNTNVMAITGPVISSIARIVASLAGNPLFIQRLYILDHDDRIVDDNPDSDDQSQHG